VSRASRPFEVRRATFAPLSVVGLLLEHHSLLVGDRQRWSGETYTPTANPYLQVTTIACSRVVILVSQSLRFLRKLEWHLPFES
jgi:hypothetical protein